MALPYAKPRSLSSLVLRCTAARGVVPCGRSGGVVVGQVIRRGDYCWNAKVGTVLVVDEVGELTYICAFVAVTDGKRTLHYGLLTGESLTKIEYPAELRALADMLA